MAADCSTVRWRFIVDSNRGSFKQFCFPNCKPQIGSRDSSTDIFTVQTLVNVLARRRLIERPKDPVFTGGV
jgi:hypothetical protein